MQRGVLPDYVGERERDYQRPLVQVSTRLHQEDEEVAVQKKSCPVERSSPVDIGLVDVEARSEQLQNHIYAGERRENAPPAPCSHA